MILSAQTIRELSTRPYTLGKRALVSPFKERTVVNGKTFGLSSCGYDVRVEFAVGNMANFYPAQQFGNGQWKRGHTFLLASTMERFCLPHNIRGTVHDKSSWIRRGLTVGNTVIEPGWRGYLTLELIYHGEDELVICADDPIAQISFEYLDQDTEQPYTGKYQNQKYGPQEAIEETP